MNFKILFLIPFFIFPAYGLCLEREGTEFKIFQFPHNSMPRIDGDTRDWEIVGEEYTYRTSHLDGRFGGHGEAIDTTDIDVSVKVGWVKGENKLYFLYEAYDDYWDFSLFSEQYGYRNDIFEIAVDADISGGPIIKNPQIEDQIENHFHYSGIMAQNYHIFTPPVNGQWCLVWGSQPWICRFPWANYAYKYNFKPGESGKLILEFWITPFDYASPGGHAHSAVSKLEENSIIGLSWALLDFDNGVKDGKNNINLSHNIIMVNTASALCAFRLMPVEKSLLSPAEAQWSYKVIDIGRRLVYFRDESIGDIKGWKWDFGDGESSKEQFPVHQYKKQGSSFNVLLEIEDFSAVKSSKRDNVSLK